VHTVQCMQSVSCHHELNVGQRFVVCSILLSPDARKKFLIRRTQLGYTKPRAYLLHLLDLYQEMLVQKKENLNHKPLTRYQKAGQGLRKVNMRLDWKYWVQCTLLARGLGVSVCYLIAYLIDLDARPDGDKEKKGVPTNRICRDDLRYSQYLTGRIRVFLFDNRLERALQFVSRERDPRMAALREKILREWAAKLRNRDKPAQSE